MTGKAAEEGAGQDEVVGGAGARFQVIKIIGAGGMGEVCLAKDTALQRMVAIKTIRRDLCSNLSVRKRVERECLLHARVGPHPNIVTLFDKLEQDERLYLVMEYVDGEVLQDRLLRAAGGGRRMTLGEALTITEQCLDALTRIHQHDIIHRDIKPSNILLSWDESRGICAKLMDFGIAYLDDKESELSRLTQSDGVGPGTPLYMSPEQIDSRRYGPVTPATDIYAIGILLYEMVSGQPPFTGSFTEIFNGHLNSPVPPLSLGEHMQLSGHLTTVLKRALAKEPENRFPSAIEYRKAVLDILAEAGEWKSELAGKEALVLQSQNDDSKTPVPRASHRGPALFAESHEPTLPEVKIPSILRTHTPGQRMLFNWISAAAVAIILVLAVGMARAWLGGTDLSATPEGPAAGVLTPPSGGDPALQPLPWRDVPEEASGAGAPLAQPAPAPGDAVLARASDGQPTSVVVAVPKVAAPATDSEAAHPESYTVQPGDTFSEIAKRFELDPETLARWNQLKRPGLLQPGTLLLLSEPPNLPDIGPIDWSSPAGSGPADASGKEGAAGESTIPDGQATPAAASRPPAAAEESPQRRGARLKRIPD